MMMMLAGNNPVATLLKELVVGECISKYAYIFEILLCGESHWDNGNVRRKTIDIHVLFYHGIANTTADFYFFLQ